MLSEKLKEKSLYVKSLPLYMRNDKGLMGQLDVFYRIMLSFDEACDKFLRYLNLFSNKNKTEVERTWEEMQSWSTTENAFLEIIGGIYGIKRDVWLKLDDKGYPILDPAEKYVTLNNEDFKLLIDIERVKNGYTGKFEDVEEFYKRADMPMYYLNHNNATVLINLDLSQYTERPNVVKLFMNGKLNLISMGILYQYETTYYEGYVLWAGPDSPEFVKQNKWDEGKWR